MKTESTKKLLYLTVQISLIAQIITGVVDAYALTLKYTGDFLLIKGLLAIELFVQIIEFIFYVWLFSYFTDTSNITPKRYYDWVITTPSMLFILIIYLEYLRNDETVPDFDGEPTTFNYMLHAHEKHGYNFTIILVLNLLMLIFGYLGEVNLIKNTTAVFYGFIPFILYFYFIYDKYAKYTNNGKILFYIFSGIWGLYGLSALCPYLWKNIFYNILDIFSKNFFGIFLAYIAIKNHIKDE